MRASSPLKKSSGLRATRDQHDERADCGQAGSYPHPRHPRSPVLARIIHEDRHEGDEKPFWQGDQAIRAETGPRVPSELESAASDAARKASRWTQ